MTSTASSGATSTASRTSTRNPAGQSLRRSLGCRSRMTSRRPTLLTTTAAAIPQAAAGLGRAARARGRRCPTIPAARPCSAAMPPSAALSSPYGLGSDELCRDACDDPEQRAAERAARTTTGVEAVYQLRGPSWTTTCSAATAARAVRNGDRNGRVERRPGTGQPERVAPLPRAGARSRHVFRGRDRRRPQPGGVVRLGGPAGRSWARARRR